MNLPINNFKMKAINNLFTKSIKLCPLSLKKFSKISAGSNGMKKFMMKINGTYTGKILGKILFQNIHILY